MPYWHPSRKNNTRRAPATFAVFGVRSIVLTFVLMLMRHIPLARGIIELILSVKARENSGSAAAPRFALSPFGVVLSRV